MAADEANGCVLLWEIKNISHCWLEAYDEISSLTFTADVLEGTKWALYLCSKVNKDSNAGESSIGVFLSRKGNCSGPNDIEVRFQFALLGKEGSLLKEITSHNNFQKGDDSEYHTFEAWEHIFITHRETFLPDDTLTVQCAIWKKEKPVKPQRFYCQTVFRVNRRSFVWRIDDFSSLKSGVKNKFTDNLLKFDLVLNKGLDLDKKLLLNINPCEEKVKYFSLKISIIDFEGGKEDCVTHEYFPDDLKNGVVSTFLFSKKLTDNRNRYLPDDVLSLDCEYVYSDGSFLYEYCGCGPIVPELKSEAVESRPESISVKEDTPIRKSLVDDLKFMYDDAICSDTVFRTSTQTFPVHKDILSARSPVFRSMFNNDMGENCGHVDITDFEDNTILRMLTYIYTDSLEDLQFEAAIKLYAIADKYQILSLRSKCSSLLKDNFSHTNVCDVLVLADLHHDDDLKTAVVDYILEQRKQIFCSQEWKDFMSSHLKLSADIMYRCHVQIYQG